jgi:hypothetical protein
MYTTIEADIKNGRIRSTEDQKIPAEAHVLITFLTAVPAHIPGTKNSQSMRGALKQYANSELRRLEKSAWCQAIEQKHEAD